MKLLLLLLGIIIGSLAGMYANQKVIAENFVLVPRGAWCYVDHFAATQLRPGDVIGLDRDPTESEPTDAEVCIGTTSNFVSIVDSIRGDTIWFHTLPPRR